jgi:hypothetical protein
MKRLFLAGAIAAALGLSACATPTPYQPLASKGAVRGGFTDVKVSSDRYRITFQGNSDTDRDTVERYLLYRAAERTLADGYDWFMLTNRATDTQRREISTPGSFNRWEPDWYYLGRGRWIVAPRTDPFWGGDYDRTEVTQFRATAEILLGKGKKPSADAGAFDAHDVQSSLAATIVRPTP